MTPCVLCVLCLPCVFSHRRTLVSGLPSLHYLDSLPVDEVERAGAAAWLRGGREAEQVRTGPMHLASLHLCAVLMHIRSSHACKAARTGGWYLAGACWVQCQAVCVACVCMCVCVCVQAARLACRDEQRRALRRTQVAFAVERAKRRVAKALGKTHTHTHTVSGPPRARF